jgi:hypothetical protein
MPLQHFTLLMAVGKKSGLVWKGLQQHQEAHLIAEFQVSTFESAAHLVGMAKEPAAEPFRSRPPMLVRRRGSYAAQVLCFGVQRTSDIWQRGGVSRGVACG